VVGRSSTSCEHNPIGSSGVIWDLNALLLLLLNRQVF